MRLPEIQTRLRVMASDLRREGFPADPVPVADELEGLAEAMSRKPRATNSPVTSRRMSPAVAREIIALHRLRPELTQHDIARCTGTNQGRVSEVLAGKRK
jgi:hypothetical protein